MTLAARLHAVAHWMIENALLSPAPLGREQRDEQMASLTFYPTTGRRVMGLPSKCPGTVSPVRGATEEETLDGRES